MTTLVEYQYVIATEFPNQKVDVARWAQEIRDADITIALDHCREEEIHAVAVFKGTLPGAEETILDGIVAAHSGEYLAVVDDTAKTSDKKLIVRPDPRPLGMNVYFTSIGDTPTGIGDGQEFVWDFSTTDNDVPSPPAGWKQKQIDISFSEELWIKDGWLFYSGMLKGSWIKVCIMCPVGAYYINHLGIPTQAGVETEVYCYMPKMILIGDNYQGTPFDSEGAMDALPNYYFLRAIITVPDTDDASYGHAMIKAYRKRTLLLPGESI